MTKEEWVKFEKVMGWWHGLAILEADGLQVSFYRGELSKNRLGIVCYVNGKFDPQWMNPANEAPEQKAMRPVNRYIFSSKLRNLSKYKKNQFKKLGCDPDKKRSMFLSTWHSGAQIRRHYQKTFKDIKIIKLSEYQI